MVFAQDILLDFLYCDFFFIVFELEVVLLLKISGSRSSEEDYGASSFWPFERDYLALGFRLLRLVKFLVI